jgi:hypothetical protein
LIPLLNPCFFNALRSALSPFLKNKEDSDYHKSETDKIIPFEFFLKIEDRKDRENKQCDHFLYGFQFCCCEPAMSDTVGRNLKTIFNKGDSPRDKNHKHKRFVFELEMSIPGKSHEDIRGEKKQNSFHDIESLLRRENISAFPRSGKFSLFDSQFNAPVSLSAFFCIVAINGFVWPVAFESELIRRDSF